MSETLKRLMLEAGYAAPEIATRAHVLAELIVKELVSIIENKVPTSYNKEQHPNSYEAGHDCGMLYATYLVKQHFGVKNELY